MDCNVGACFCPFRFDSLAHSRYTVCIRHTVIFRGDGLLRHLGISDNDVTLPRIFANFRDKSRPILPQESAPDPSRFSVLHYDSRAARTPEHYSICLCVHLHNDVFFLGSLQTSPTPLVVVCRGTVLSSMAVHFCHRGTECPALLLDRYACMSAYAHRSQAQWVR